MKQVQDFLREHGFYADFDLEKLAKEIQADMIAGLSGKKSYQDMTPTYFDPDALNMQEKSVIVIDAGGTNFRSSLVTFKKDGTASISRFEKTKMPASDCELCKKDFFAQIAKNIARFKNEYDEICFCFSYAMSITEDQDGILINFSKEVKAPEVVGCKIGRELKNALLEDGWTKIPRIILLNDTVSTLLAGVSEKKYSSYIGYILGTGMNCAYVQPKNADYELERQIVVCESAKFGGFKNSDFDILLDEKSTKPGTSPLEKLCSGAYVGSLALETLQMGAKEHLFSDDFNAKITERASLSLIDVSTFLQESDEKKGDYSELFENENANQDDCTKIFVIFDALTNRMAQISASVIFAALLQCGEGKNPEEPICISCNGSSFFKTHKVQERTKTYLAELAEKAALHYELLPDEADNSIGTAKAGLRADFSESR